MKNVSLVLCFILSISGCAQHNPKTDRPVGSPCEDCDLMFQGMPENLNWQTTIAGQDEPGEPLIIRGTIYKSDKTTPAPNVVLYVYHTDNKGKYTPASNQINGRRHGHLRGWMKTDSQGHYEFKTIRPASYPNSKNPQHIHPIIKETGITLYWIDEFTFTDDPLITETERAHMQNRGGSGHISLKKNEKGIWEGTRDIILGLNIPNY